MRKWLGAVGMCFVALCALFCVDQHAHARPAEHQAVAAGAVGQGISLGYEHSCAVTVDGHVWCWGANDKGQLGRGTETALEADPAPVVGLENAISVSVGLEHSCALRRDGTVWCWGDDTYGQLGNNSYGGHEDAPVEALNLGLVISLAAGQAHTCAVDAYGSVYCWGDNSYDQLDLGYGVAEPTYTGIQAGAVFSSALSNHTCALTGSHVTCWGANDSGQSGATIEPNQPTTPPVAVSGLDGPVTSLATGLDFTCGLLASGAVQCWGNNVEGQLGTGQTSGPTATPVSVSLDPTDDATNISAGLWHACARLSNGQLRCWGRNAEGQLGRHSVSENEASPAAVATVCLWGTCNPSAWSDVEAGGLYTCGAAGDGRVYCWGDNYSGQLGQQGVCTGAGCSSSYPPLAPIGGSGFQNPVPLINFSSGEDVHVGYANACMRLADGRASCWGWNTKGELGNGTPSTQETTPVHPDLPPGSHAISVHPGYQYACALLANGTVWCWGDNQYGELGQGDTVDRPEPTQVPGLSNVVEVGVRFATTCALLVDGRLECWGYNYDGEAGVDPNTSGTVVSPQQVAGTYAHVARGSFFTCALAKGIPYCWGQDDYGQLGRGGTGSDYVPVPVNGLQDVTELSPGTTTACAVSGTADDLKCWGDNSYGQFGDGYYTSSTVPSLVESGYTGDISTGYRFSCRTNSYGYLQCAGVNDYGQLGDGDTETQTANPTYVDDYVVPRSFSSAYFNTCRLAADGSLDCWGDDEAGQTGDGQVRQSDDPVRSPTSVADNVLPCSNADADDGNPCTIDDCDHYAGVEHTMVTAGSDICKDSNACNGTETCDGIGNCVAGTPPAIDDGNPCTDDVCTTDANGNPVVTHPQLSDGTPCDPGDLCLQDASCQSGSCQGTAVDPDDGDPCTDDTCDAATGISHTFSDAGTNCGTGLECDGADHCTAVTVVPGQDPGDVAPTLDPTVPGSFADSVSYLYDPANGIQTLPPESDPTQIFSDARRIGVVTGVVTDRDDHLPLPGVLVSVKDHPEYGSVLTTLQGTFDIAVNGGGVLTLELTRPDRLDVQRKVRVPWNDYTPEVNVEMVAFDQNPDTISGLDGTLSGGDMAVGDGESDNSGARTARVFFPSGTKAWLDDGNFATSQSTVSVKEYTVGDNGVDAMPGDLPPNSAYTYAVDLKIDGEGATFYDSNCTTPPNCTEQPVFFYLDNFLDFPVGAQVPAGYYDKTTGAWVQFREASGAALNGCVISISDDGSHTAVAVDNTGCDSDTWTTVPTTLEERQKLYDEYSSELPLTLWRIPMSHFSALDANWPFGAPGCGDGGPCPDDGSPGAPVGPQPVTGCQSSDQEGSIIECENQVIGEEIPIAGTPFKLHYQSNRVPGHTVPNHLLIELTGDPAPTGLTRVDYSVTIAGRTYHRTKGPDPSNDPAGQNRDFWPHETVDFGDWDGTDTYGRNVNGPQKAHVVVSNIYPAVYMGAQGFANNGAYGSDPAFQADRSRMEVKRTWEYDTVVGGYHADTNDFGGWTLDVHHTYDNATRTMLFGNGDELRTSAQGNVITKVADTSITPTYLAAGPDGTVYFSSYWDGYVKRVDEAGQVSVVAGDGDRSDLGPTGLGVGPDGSLYIADNYNDRILRRDPQGNLTTYAGTSQVPSSETENGTPADATWVEAPIGIAVAPDGTVYYSEGQHAGVGHEALRLGYRVRKIAPGPDGSDRVVTTVAGNGENMSNGDDLAWPVEHDNSGGVVGTDATDANIGTANDLALGPDGSLYLATDAQWAAVWRVSTDGFIHKVAGNNGYVQYWQDNVAAKGCYMGDLAGLGIAPDGRLLTAEGPDKGYRIRVLGSDGKIRTFAGPGGGGSSGDGGIATAASFNKAFDAVALPDGSVWISDENGQEIRRVQRTLPGPPALDSDTVLIASSDGSQHYILNSAGRHLATRNTLTGQDVYTFGYTGNLLTSIDTNDGAPATTVARNASGIDITAPHGQVTHLSLDSNGYVSDILLPTGQHVKPELDSSGLMTAFTDAQGKKSLMYYDSEGRLTAEYDADTQELGGSKTLSRVDQDPRHYQVTFQTHLGRTSTYDVNNHISGTGISGDPLLVSSETKTNPAGNVTTYSTDNHGVVTKDLPDGTKVSHTPVPDPLGGLVVQNLGAVTTTLPVSGLTKTVTTTRATTVDQNGYVSDSTRTRTINGTDTSTAAYHHSTDPGEPEYQVVTTSAAGRIASETLDDHGRITHLEWLDVPSQNVDPVDFAYDQGRLKTVTQGSRTWRATFDPTSGYPSSILDAALHTTNLATDEFGRTLSTTRDPGTAPHLNLTTTMTYDGAGDLTSVTPPKGAQHGQAFTLGQRTSSYTAPPPNTGDGSLISHYFYNADRQNTSIVTPAGTITRNYDSTTGRLTDIAASDQGWPNSSTSISYHYLPSGSGAGHLGEADATTTYWDGSSEKQVVDTNFGYDGFLMTSMGWSWTPVGSASAVHGALVRSHDDDFRVQQNKFTLFGDDYYSSLGYDADGLLTCESPTPAPTPPAPPCGSVSPYLDVTRDGPLGAVSLTSIEVVGDTWDYNNYAELADYSAVADGNDVYSVTYDDGGTNARDALGRVLHKHEVLNGNVTDTDYSYDAANRLASTQVNGGTVHNFSYDDNGNRHLAPDPTNDPATTYDDDDRLKRWNDEYTYTWTTNGELKTRTNLSTGLTRQFFYDRFGDLIDFMGDGNSFETRYVLDGLRRRVARVDWPSKAVKEVYFYLDSLRVGAIEHIGEDQTLSAVAYFIYGTRRNIPDLVVNYDPVLGTNIYRVISDQLGSPVVVVGIYGDDQVFQASYDAWGNSTRSGIGTGDANWKFWFPFDFAGGLYDPQTKLVRFGARDYDPEVGRWTNRDPIRFEGGQGNLYVYAGDDPVNMQDPRGTDDQGYGHFLRCAYALAFCRFVTCEDPLDPIEAGACGACITAAIVTYCRQPFGFPDPGPSGPRPPPSGPPPMTPTCPPGEHPVFGGGDRCEPDAPNQCLRGHDGDF